MLFFDSDATANDGRLADAVQQQDATTVEQLLGQRIDVNEVQPDGTTALHWAAHWNDLKIASSLIQAGANLDAANRYGSTPLLLACENGSAPLIKMMTTAGADPNLFDYCMTITILRIVARRVCRRNLPDLQRLNSHR